jgi:hypothetical protein
MQTPRSWKYLTPKDPNLHSKIQKQVQNLTRIQGHTCRGTGIATGTRTDSVYDHIRGYGILVSPDGVVVT